MEGQGLQHAAWTDPRFEKEHARRSTDYNRRYATAGILSESCGIVHAARALNKQWQCASTRPPAKAGISQPDCFITNTDGATCGVICDLSRTMHNSGSWKSMSCGTRNAVRGRECPDARLPHLVKETKLKLKRGDFSARKHGRPQLLHHATEKTVGHLLCHPRDP